MNNTYKLRVNSSFEFDVTEEDIANIDALSTANKKYHILNDHESYHAEIVASNFLDKQYTVKINSNSYEVNISDDLDKLINDMGFALGASKNVNTIKAPMPGLILDIHTKEGETVKEGDFLLVLEAMKMENVITSPRDGIIKSITASSGDAVDKGKILVEFES